MKINVKIDTSQLDYLVDQANKQINRKLPQITIQGAKSFADNAAKMIPPKKNGQFSKTISANQYKRKIHQIVPILRKFPKSKKTEQKKSHNKFIQSLLDNIKEKNIFYVLGYSKGKSKYWFGKRKSDLRKYERILTRGLWKIMFGLNLSKFSAIPKSIQSLIAKSPIISGWKGLNPIQTVKSHDKYNIKMENLINIEEAKKFNNGSNLQRIAVQVGTKYCLGTMRQQAMNVVYDLLKRFNK